MKREMIRQGDVLLIPVTVTGQLGALLEKGEVTLAHGEATGHRHRIRKGAAMYDLKSDQPSQRVEHARKVLQGLPELDIDTLIRGVVRVSTPEHLVHEEHAAIPVEGDYLVVQQREYTPAGIQAVVD